MGMIDGGTDVPEQLQAFPYSVLLVVTEVRDGNALEQFHRKIGPSAGGRSCLEHSGDVGMIHHGQRLTFGLEARQHLVRIHSRLHDLDGHLPGDRLRLLRHPDNAESAFADLLEQGVGTNARAFPFRELGRMLLHRF